MEQSRTTEQHCEVWLCVCNGWKRGTKEVLRRNEWNATVRIEAAAVVYQWQCYPENHAAKYNLIHFFFILTTLVLPLTAFLIFSLFLFALNFVLLICTHMHSSNSKYLWKVTNDLKVVLLFYFPPYLFLVVCSFAQTLLYHWMCLILCTHQHQHQNDGSMRPVHSISHLSLFLNSLFTWGKKG